MSNFANGNMSGLAVQTPLILLATARYGVITNATPPKVQKTGLSDVGDGTLTTVSTIWALPLFGGSGNGKQYSRKAEAAQALDIREATHTTQLLVGTTTGTQLTRCGESVTAP
jgi:hypothetical protein